MLRVYLASPDNQLQANAAREQPVLLSFALASKKPFLEKGYLASFGRVLCDSGAFSAHNSGAVIDPVAYRAWAESIPWADNWAALDSIAGDWREGMKNAEAFGFPTFHDSDPDDTLEPLIQISRERGNWLGIGLLPPRTGRGDWLARTLDRIPEDIHVHGWALGGYALTHHRINSFDSTHWWRDGQKLRQRMPWLTYGETLEIMVKKMQRMRRTSVETVGQEEMFSGATVLETAEGVGE